MAENCVINTLKRLLGKLKEFENLISTSFSLFRHYMKIVLRLPEIDVAPLSTNTNAQKKKKILTKTLFNGILLQRINKHTFFFLPK